MNKCVCKFNWGRTNQEPVFKVDNIYNFKYTNHPMNKYDFMVNVDCNEFESYSLTYNEFKLHFIKIEEYRNNKIEIILDE